MSETKTSSPVRKCREELLGDYMLAWSDGRDEEAREIMTKLHALDDDSEVEFDCD